MASSFTALAIRGSVPALVKKGFKLLLTKTETGARVIDARFVLPSLQVERRMKSEIAPHNVTDYMPINSTLLANPHAVPCVRDFLDIPDGVTLILAKDVTTTAQNAACIQEDRRVVRENRMARG